jgi:MoaA/NifB/PqqE/SkfB family radical SAM enzyme
MCPTGLRATGRPTGFMDIETFKSILAKTAKTSAAIRFIGWGEPTLHPNIFKMVEMAVKSGRMTHLNTNGRFEKKEIFQILDSGLHSIKFSMQGATEEKYAEMRSCHRFHLTREMAKLLKSVRTAMCRQFPFIAISTTVTNETAGDINEFVWDAPEYCDEMSVGLTTFDFIDDTLLTETQVEQLNEFKAQQKVEKRHPNPCPEVFSKLSISWDGSVRVCCNDYQGVTYLGDIRYDGMHSIWNNPAMEEYRSRLNNNEYVGPLCSVCYDYMALTKGK